MKILWSQHKTIPIITKISVKCFLKYSPTQIELLISSWTMLQSEVHGFICTNEQCDYF